ncbi:response regulator, partial [Escherichia coli]|uniref:response regulator n=1 Tax=Escherichia coli TaxID=562 RepID=UPI00273A331F
NLEELGYSITAIADSGEQAIKEAVINQPDLVLMDVRLKGKMDGVQASEIIWNNLRIPVVYLTANSDINTIQRAKNTE